MKSQKKEAWSLLDEEQFMSLLVDIFMFMVKEQPWKFPYGRTALRLTSLERRMFWPFWIADMLISFDWRILSPGLFRAIDPVDSDETRTWSLTWSLTVEFFSFLCMKDVSTDDVLELMQGGPFALTFHTCIGFMTSHFFNLYWDDRIGSLLSLYCIHNWHYSKSWS